MSEAILKIENLSKNYGKFAAVKDVSLELKKGEVFGEDIFLQLTGDFDADTKQLLEELGA